MAVIRDQGKTTFTREVLTRNKTATPKDVNEAWKAAGHPGSISESIVFKVRSDMKLTGNIRPGRRPAGAGGAAPKATSGAVVKRAVGRPPKRKSSAAVRPSVVAEGRRNAATSQATPKAASGRTPRTELLTDLEHRIDAMLFEVHSAGGFPEFEDALRAARRVLARAHSE